MINTTKTWVSLDTSERIAILGASRGLGLALVEQLLNHSQSSLWLSSRRVSALMQQPLIQAHSERVQWSELDFTRSEQFEILVEKLRAYRPHRLIYSAGGGPFGDFAQRPWHAHAWAYQLNLLVPAELTHRLLQDHSNDFSSLKQIVFIGSAIAENAADPGACSYASSKHGLKGLLQSLVAENSTPGLDLRLYSPGYMDTTLLPPHSRPRQDGSLIADPLKIAEDLLRWVTAPPPPDHWHRASTNI